MFPLSAQAQTWWSADYNNRGTIEVTTGANTPDNDYDGYTVRLNDIDTATWISSGEMRTDCNDLRVVHWDGSTNTELPRHVIDCNTSSTDIRFKMIATQAASTTSSDYYIYYDHSGATTPTALSTNNVYLWYDDGTVDRLDTYTYGRFDAWASTGYYSGTSYNADGYYQYATGDNMTFGMRQNVDERDVYVEVETYHIRCYPYNIGVGPITRVITTGSGGTESSDHYYVGKSGHQNGAQCSADGYAADGDIQNGSLSIVVDGANPPVLTSNQWRRTALASWRVNPTYLSYYMEDDTDDWDALGYPSATNLHVSGTDATDTEGQGEAGYAATQDQGRLRHMLIRRYVEPEPALTLTLTLTLTSEGILEASKSVEVYDPDSLGLYPIPGNELIYTITATNVGTGAVDTDSIVLIDTIPSELEFYNGDIDDDGSEVEPVSFTQSTGAGLSFTYASDVGFSNSATQPADFSACTYTPSSGYDANVNYICFNPKGAMAAGTPDPSLSVSFRVRIK